MRELYDMINNLTIKEGGEDEVEKIPSDNKEKLTIGNTEKQSQEDEIVVSEPNDKLVSEPTEEVAETNSKINSKPTGEVEELNENKKEIKTNIPEQNNNEDNIPVNNNLLKINTDVTKYIPRKKNSSSNDNKKTETLANNANNLTGSLPKDTIKNESKKLLNQSSELTSFEVIGSTKNDKKDTSNQIKQPSILNYSEILFQSQNNKITEQPQSIFYNSPQQAYSDVLCNSPEEEESSPHNLLCVSPQESYSEMLCESPVDEYNDDNHTVLCNSPEGTYSEMICESPVNEFPKDDFDSRSMLFTSPEQKFSDQIVQSSTEQTAHSSPEQTAQSSPRHKAVRKSTGYSFNSIEALMGNFSFQKRESNTISNHDKELLYSQLKMTELSRKTDNSLQMSSILGSSPEDKSKILNPYQPKPSQNSDSVQSVYSYDNVDTFCSRKITKRGIRVLRSRDTLDRQRPVHIRSRRRKALLIGINYKNKPYELHGCINDANYIMSFLKENYDFKEENCKIMTDDAEDESLIPTKKNIINAMKWLVGGAKEGDSLFFHYSGHGLSFTDKNGDEIDGLDESILPIDYEVNGVILDDEIHDLIVKPLPKGCLLTALADCCHSGTVLDLPYIYNTNGELEDVNDMDEDHKELSKEYFSNEIYEKNKIVQQIINRNASPPPISLSIEERKRIDSFIKKARQSKADVIQYSSCRDNEISADERANGNTYGALCNAFVSTLTSLILEEKSISYCELLKELRSIIQKRYGQTPQLSTGRLMDVTQPFEI